MGTNLWHVHGYLPYQVRRIKDDALAEDLDRFYVDQGCVDVDIIIEQYDKYLSDLLDKHAPKSIYMW